MAYYPDVTPGTPVSFSAGRETAINRLLNQADGFKTGVIAGKTSPVVRVQVWNSTQTAFAAGQAVQIDVSGSLCGNAFPAVNFASVDAPFGVCANGIAPNAIGDLIFSGPASVTIGGATTGYYARPVSGGTFTRGNEGVKILNISGGTNAVVMLGDYKSAGTGYVAGKGISSTDLAEGVIAADLVQGTDISITGTTTLTISYTGSGGGGGGNFFPDFTATPIDVYGSTVSEDTTYQVESNMWLIGTAGLDGVPTGEDYVQLYLDTNTTPYLELFRLSTYQEQGLPNRRLLVSICIPISAGHTIWVYESGHVTSSLKLYYT